MGENIGINREYKDRLFKFIFGNPDKKEWTLSLYNAMNGSHYTDPEAISLNMIEDAFYMGMRNDVSFLIADTLNFYEHQSSLNPNMPMRFLIYAGMLYDKYTETNADYHRFSAKQQKAPTPKCVCFYNGRKETGDRTVLHLSDSFAPDAEPDIEVKVTMININYGHNEELMQACKPLGDYAYFVNEARANQKTMGSLAAAVDAAIANLPDHSLIKPFLIANRSEVKSMFITEYDEERHIAELEEEYKAEGRAEGMLMMLSNLVKDGLLTISQAAERVDMTAAEFESRMQTI